MPRRFTSPLFRARARRTTPRAFGRVTARSTPRPVAGSFTATPLGRTPLPGIRPGGGGDLRGPPSIRPPGPQNTGPLPVGRPQSNVPRFGGALAWRRNQRRLAAGRPVPPRALGGPGGLPGGAARFGARRAVGPMTAVTPPLTPTPPVAPSPTLPPPTLKPKTVRLSDAIKSGAAYDPNAVYVDDAGKPSSNYWSVAQLRDILTNGVFGGGPATPGSNSRAPKPPETTAAPQRTPLQANPTTLPGSLRARLLTARRRRPLKPAQMRAARSHKHLRYR
jgi:hypothetical protein